MAIPKLRVEEPAEMPKPQLVKLPPMAGSADVARLTKERDEWRTQAIQAGERLQHAETQLRDLRQAADENRARMNKAKTRQESAQAKVNELQVEVISLRAERDDLRDKQRNLEAIRKKVHDIFVELQD